ncbi:fluoride efflux transporter FluC [Rhodococcus rhodnii]|uniref:Fluoride-specific ion channel FluC n=1 Tax=Rhodococcus rhodnii LMG 5362 TaxID=1273125 RepID=R7WRE6_9NOCA|nr:CrcB family protein [Rhodococcus rhodnii]EOM76554.1 hypothetical protein Rrhod_2094 [Rhodococcus rhodnii LMG 5362]
MWSARRLPFDPDSLPPHVRPETIGLVFAGGALGSVARWGVGIALDSGGAWPWATFTVNLVGAFVLGALLETLTVAGTDTGWRRRVRLACGTGFLGAFTTYSAFAVDSMLLIRAGSPGVALGYTVATVCCGFVATAAGIVAAGAMARGRLR